MSLKNGIALVLVLGCTSSYEGSSESSGGRVASAVARLTAETETCSEEARACYGEAGACEVELGAFVGCSADAGCGGWDGVEITCAEVSCAAEYETLAVCYVDAESCRALDACWTASMVEAAPPADGEPADGEPTDESRECVAEATACYGPTAPCGASLSTLLACSDAAGCGTSTIELACLEASCASLLESFEACYFDASECRPLDTCFGDETEPSEPTEPEPSEPDSFCAEEDALCSGEGGACAAAVAAILPCARESACEDDACIAAACPDLYEAYTLCTFSEAGCRPALDCRLESAGPLDTCTEASVACYFGGPCVEEYAAAYAREIGGVSDEALLDALLACEAAECPAVQAACGS